MLNPLYPIRLTLDLPTSHLTTDTRHFMEQQAQETGENGTEGGSVLDVGNMPYGWFVRVRDDIAEKLPSDLAACMAKAREIGCEFILFDMDADASPRTGDLPVYDEHDQAIDREEANNTEQVGEITVYVLSTVNPEEGSSTKPRIPDVFLDESTANAAYRKAMRDEWERNGPENEEGAREPFPDHLESYEINDLIVESAGENWGEYALTSHDVPLGKPAAAPIKETATIAAAGPRILATFYPQAWQGNNAVPVDPQGTTNWDVTETIVAMGRETALQLCDNTDASDNLAQSATAPDWIRNWSGPFYVEVRHAVEEYYAAIDAASHQGADIAA